MASVYQVYSTLKNLANKDEKGFVTPQNFNTFAPVAQTAVFNKILDAIAVSKAKRASTQGTLTSSLTSLHSSKTSLHL
jgi:hypothetical protein